VLNRPSNMPLADYLTGWLESRRPALKPSTLAGYEAVVRSWVVPHIGAVRLAEIKPTVLTKLYTHLRAHGAKPTPAERRRAAIWGERPVGTPLGSRSVQSVHTVLHMALTDAVEQGLLQVAPTTQTPKRQRPTHRNRRQADKHWDADEAARFLAVTTDHRLHPLWALLVDTGCRRGEVCALRWTSVDLEAGTVTVKANRVHAGRQVVEGTTKTDRVRTVDLDARTVAVLRGWQGADGRAAGGRRRLRRVGLRIHHRDRRTGPTRLIDLRVYEGRQAGRGAGHRGARVAAHGGDLVVGRRCATPRCAGAARSRRHLDHVGAVQPRAAAAACRRRPVAGQRHLRGGVMSEHDEADDYGHRDDDLDESLGRRGGH
jgi:integrase